MEVEFIQKVSFILEIIRSFRIFTFSVEAFIITINYFMVEKASTTMEECFYFMEWLKITIIINFAIIMAMEEVTFIIILIRVVKSIKVISIVIIINLVVIEFS